MTKVLEVTDAMMEDLNNDNICWVCNNSTTGLARPFCSDKCEQQYEADMTAQGEDVS